MSDPYYWDGKHVHFQALGGDHHAMNMACGIILSTWVGPNARSRDTTEDRVGYTFENYKLVDCPACVKWMETNLQRCIRCGDVCSYEFCAECLDYCVCGTLLLGEKAQERGWEHHRPTCTGRALAPKKPVPQGDHMKTVTISLTATEAGVNTTNLAAFFNLQLRKLGLVAKVEDPTNDDAGAKIRNLAADEFTLGQELAKQFGQQDTDPTLLVVLNTGFQAPKADADKA